MNKVVAVAVAGVLGGVAAGAQGVVELRVHMPGIVGEESTAGYPGAMAVDSVTISPQLMSFTKDIDSASPQIMQAALQGTAFPAVSFMQYNPPASGAPDAAMSLPEVLIGGAILGGLAMTVDLNASAPGSLYLVVPGIAGDDGVAGYPQAMRIDSVTINAAGDFYVDRVVDTASPQLFLAVAQGTAFPTASLLFYDGAVAGAEPDAVFSYSNLLATAYQTTGGLAAPTERVTFSFAAVPEPGTAGVMGAGAAAMGLCGRSRRRKF